MYKVQQNLARTFASKTKGSDGYTCGIKRILKTAEVLGAEDCVKQILEGYKQGYVYGDKAEKTNFLEKGTNEITKPLTPSNSYSEKVNVESKDKNNGREL